MTEVPRMPDAGRLNRVINTGRRSTMGTSALADNLRLILGVTVAVLVVLAVGIRAYLFVRVVRIEEAAPAVSTPAAPWRTPPDEPQGPPLPPVWQGRWRFDGARTIAEWRKASGLPELDSEMERLGIELHEDVTVHGATLEGKLVRYDVSQWKQEGRVIRGVAWFHEDKGDPGDMSTVDVRLELAGPELWLDVTVEGNATRYIFRR
jgi:hypothetical protein